MRDSTTDRVEITRVLPFPRERVFAAWTDPESLRQWFCPFDSRVADAAIDPQPGGRYQIDMMVQGQRMEHRGHYVTVDPPRSLVFTWSSPATGWAETLVTVLLE